MSIEIKTPQQKGHPASISHLLTLLADGEFHGEASEALRDLCETLSLHAENTRQKCSGTLTLKLKVKLDKGIFELTPDLKVAKPEPVRGRDIFWCDENHNLTPENPRQHRMEFREVTERRDVREA